MRGRNVTRLSPLVSVVTSACMDAIPGTFELYVETICSTVQVVPGSVYSWPEVEITTIVLFINVSLAKVKKEGRVCLGYVTFVTLRIPLDSAYVRVFFLKKVRTSSKYFYHKIWDYLI